MFTFPLYLNQSINPHQGILQVNFNVENKNYTKINFQGNVANFFLTQTCIPINVQLCVCYG